MTHSASLDQLRLLISSLCFKGKKRMLLLPRLPFPISIFSPISFSFLLLPRLLACRSLVTTKDPIQHAICNLLGCRSPALGGFGIEVQDPAVFFESRIFSGWGILRSVGVLKLWIFSFFF